MRTRSPASLVACALALGLLCTLGANPARACSLVFSPEFQPVPGPAKRKPLAAPQVEVTYVSVPAINDPEGWCGLLNMLELSVHTGAGRRLPKWAGVQIQVVSGDVPEALRTALETPRQVFANLRVRSNFVYWWELTREDIPASEVVLSVRLLDRHGQAGEAAEVVLRLPGLD